MSTTNPYAAPQAAVSPIQTGASNYILATQGQRFINLIVDNIVIQVLSFGVGIVVGLSFVLLEGPNADTESATFRIVSAVAGIL